MNVIKNPAFYLCVLSVVIASLFLLIWEGEILLNYPSEERYPVRGVDVSSYQGDIDWQILSGEGISFAFIKATEGSSHTDSRFAYNFENAQKHGILTGAYHFFSKRSSARDQAYFFLENVPLEEGDLPPILDVEHKPNDKTVEEFQRDVLTWLHIVENKYHVKPIIYTYYKFKENYLADERFDDYPYWIAHYYVDVMQYSGPWKFWQHTDAGRVAGIEGEVDFNIYNGSFYDLQQLCLK